MLSGMSLQELGVKIKKARQALKFKSLKEFAEVVQIPSEKIKNYEEGKEAPPVKLIAYLCKELNIPVRAFIYGGKPRVVFRTHKKCNVSHLHNIVDETLIEALADTLRTLESLGEISPKKFERFQSTFNPEKTGEIFIKTYKLEERKFNTWDKVMNLLSEKDIYVFALPFKSKISALVHEDPPFFIVLNSNEPKDRWSFSLLHEIGHLIAPEEVKSSLQEEEENYANLFAKSVLIPKQLRIVLWKNLKKYILSWREEDYCCFFRQIREINPLISPESVFYVLVQDFYDIELGKKFFGKFKKCVKRLREKDIEFVRPDGQKYFPRKLIEIIDRLEKEGKISSNRKKELLLQK